MDLGGRAGRGVIERGRELEGGMKRGEGESGGRGVRGKVRGLFFSALILTK